MRISVLDFWAEKSYGYFYQPNIQRTKTKMEEKETRLKRLTVIHSQPQSKRIVTLKQFSKNRSNQP